MFRLDRHCYFNSQTQIKGFLKGRTDRRFSSFVDVDQNDHPDINKFLIKLTVEQETRQHFTISLRKKKLKLSGTNSIFVIDIIHNWSKLYIMISILFDVFYSIFDIFLRIKVHFVFRLIVSFRCIVVSIW